MSLLFLISVSAWAGEDQCELTDNYDGTISDSNTGLMWLQDADFMEDATWNAVKSQLETLMVGGYSDWRLPEIEELGNLYVTLNSSGTFQPTPFINLDVNGQSDWHWSGTQASDVCWWRYCQNRAWILSFETGTTYEVEVNYALNSVLVRTEGEPSCGS
ncbi:MAG: DUF1566 domain-containing protein [Gammaproteobacteria bacterium]|nr:DUF1566 domain-containing protein [Gammaproteobacteria bacterium]